MPAAPAALVGGRRAGAAAEEAGLPPSREKRLRLGLGYFLQSCFLGKPYFVFFANFFQSAPRKKGGLIVLSFFEKNICKFKAKMKIIIITEKRKLFMRIPCFHLAIIFLIKKLPNFKLSIDNFIRIV